MESIDFSLSVTAELKNLPAIRRFVDETATSLQAERDVIDGLIQAVDKVATNIMTHGYQGDRGKIEFQLRLAGETLVIRVRDQAPLFDPTLTPPPDLTAPIEERCSGGLGIHLVRCFTDQVTYQVTPEGGNELTLVKAASGKRQ